MFKNIIYLLLLTTVTMAAWIGFSVYHNSTTSTVSHDTTIRITPIPSSFDRETLTELKSRKTVPVNLREKILLPALPAKSTTESGALLQIQASKTATTSSEASPGAKL